MNHHPAAEMVAIALRKIQKIANNKKYQPLLDECQAFLDNIHQILPPAGAAAAPAASTASSSPQALADVGAASSDSLAAAAADVPAGGSAAEVPAAASHAPTQQADAVPGGELPEEPAAQPAQPAPAEAEQPAVEPVPEAHTEVPSDASTATAAPASVPASEPAPEPKAKPLPDMVPRTASALPDSVAMKMIAVLRLAVNTERPQIIEVALDCLKKLIAFKFLQGAVYVINMEKKGPKQDVMDSDKHTAVSPDDPNTKTPQAQAVELLCRCDDIPDKEVEESVLGGLLTATTSSTFTLHGQALLLAVRACYNIYLTSRVDQSQTAAKATLTQMLNVVFRRMEADEVLIEVKPIVFADMLGMARPSSMPDATTMVVANVQAFLNNVVMVAGGPTLQTPDELRASVAGALAASHDDHVPSAAMDTAGDGSPKKPSLPGALLIPQHQHNASDGTGGIAKHHGLVLNTHQQTPEETARSAVLRNDAFLVFRGLCKLSIRTSDTATSQDPAAVRGKILALELLKVLLENSGPTFRRSETFISAIRQYLCLSLLKNSSSSVLAATQLSCSIFLSLMSKFRSQLKAEVGVFFPMILLKPFEPVGPGGAPLPPAAAAAVVGPPPTIASLQYKSTILRVLSEVCRDGQLLVDLFVNYDCDLESVNLFERMVNALVKLAQQAPIAQPPSPLIVDTGNTYHQEMYVRQEALQALVHLVEAMLHWYKLTVNLVEVDLGSTDVMTPGPDGGPSVATPRDGNATPSMLDTASTTNLRELGDELAAVAATAPAPGDGGGDDLASRRAYKLKFQDCISLFNKKPKKGIELLQKEGMLGTSVAHVATFLAKCKGLDKTMIGDYLGERDDYNIKVMHAYIDNLEFAELEFDAAIRLFLSGFRLPGEAQKIDRLMEKFAERYLKCNPGSFKSADVAYVLAYSTIMLNTDLHNPQVKKKMSKEGFLKNNRGINDGQDLPEEFMSGLYDRIQNNEIKMKEEGATMAVEGAANQAKNMFTALLSIMGAFKQEQHSGPSDESIKSTLDYLHEKAKGSTAITVTESDAVRPMMEVIWAPLLGALSVSFDEYTVVQHINVCLQGITASCCLTALMGMTSLRDIFIHSLCGFTHLHSPHTMRFKNALAFKFLLLVASPERVGDHLQDQWVEVLRCISRWELLQQIASGMPTDAALFAVPNDRGVKAVLKKVFDNDSGPGVRSMESLGMSELTLKKLSIGGIAASFRKGNDEPQVPVEVINSFDSNELNAVFLSSASLSSEAVVSFVRALCAVSHDELANVNAPRIFSLTRLVEVAHFNMNRIRLVWSRIWAVLSDYFIQVGCHSNLQVAKYAVDSLRQLAMKFLERDELANYTFQNDFLRPFVVIMRQSQAVEIRDLIIRCLSQMVLARVDNVKSGWKSMFMVFTTAAGDKEPSIVNLAFDTIEKIVRLHFNHITETETTTFTDCVNCLIAFTNNPHSSTVALNSIAFLRFCAVKLAEGAIGDVNALPEGLAGRGMPLHNLRVVALDAVPESASYNNLTTAQEAEQESVPTTNFTDGSISSGAAVAAQQANLSLAANTPSEAHLQRLPDAELSFAMDRPTLHRPSKSMGLERGSAGGLHARGEGGLRFVDRDEHVYFWFPLLAGLSELTFDPRDQIRNSALEVLFDTLKAHGGTFAASFWRRVFDSVLMPIFDHVRAEVTDTTTFTSEKKREKEDYWLYETCKRCLQHLIDVFVTFYDETRGLLPQVLQLLASFINRTHQSLAAGGVYALTHLTNSAATRLEGPAWAEVTAFMLAIAQDTAPNALELVTPPSRPQASSQHTSGQPQSPQPPPEVSPQGSTSDTGAEHRDAGATASTSRPAATSMNGWQAGAAGGAGAPGYSLREGIGARRLAKFRSQSTVQLLLVQCCSDVYSKQHEHMPAPALGTLMQALECIATHSRNTDSDTALRKRLAMQQAEDKVADDRVVFDPPLLRLETEAAHAYLSVLMHVFASGREDASRLNVTSRLVDLCRATLARFALGMDPQRVLPDLQYMSDARAKHQQLQAAAAEAAAANGSRSGMLGGSGGGLLSGINLGNVNIGGVSIIGGKSAEAQRRAAAYAAAVAAATQGRTADRKSIIVGRTSTGMLVLMAAPSVEYAPFATLINSTLAAMAAFDDATFRSHLHEFFPLMTVLITTDYAPAEVLRGLADLFAQRVGPIIGVARAEAAAEMAAAAAAARLQAEQQANQVHALAQQQQQAAGSPVGSSTTQ